MGNNKKIPINKNNKLKKAKKKATISAKRVFCFIIVVMLLLVCLMGRIAYLQFVEGDYLKQREYSQSTASTIISAKRGTIYDRNKKALAISADVDTITVNPEYLVVKKNGSINEEETTKLKEKLAKKFSEIFELEYEEVLKKLESTKNTENIISKVEKDKVDELKEWLNENKIKSGINIDEDTKRYYPYDSLASNLIGFCGADNQGLDGVELSYDSTLKGTNGKRTTSISVTQAAIPDGDEQYIAPENGSNIYLTIDSNIQAIAEKYLKQAVEEYNCLDGGNVIIENPTTGEILAMVTYPTYNLNDPYTPNESISSGWDELSTQEQTNRLYTMWRNRAVLNNYEPGSTFKLITSSIALEENLVNTDDPGIFFCNGSQHVIDVDINCALTSGHGYQSLRQALENSCNPALIQLGQKIGKDNFYKYLRAYGLFEKTGIDLPSEGKSSFWSDENVGPVELATMSFGQRFTITPMQLVKAVSAIANGGKLITPHVVKEIENTESGTITTIEPNVERQVISKETSEQMKSMMQSVVEEGGGTYAQVQGYNIGGKTGTSEPNPDHPEDGYVSSFLAIAPVENTELVVLLTLYNPKSSNHYGGRIAAPAVSQILSEVLPYLDIPSNDKKAIENSNNLISVPNIKNKSLEEAQSILKAAGLKYSSVGSLDEIVTEQMPASGTQLSSGGIVKVYTKGNEDRVSQTVPDLKGVTYAQAKVMLESKNLNISSTGSGIVIAQDPKSGSEVDEGTVITVTLQEATKATQH